MSIRLLLVDDESVIHRLTLRMLEGLDIAITGAASAAEAEALLERGDDVFDVVLCDYNLPDKPGPVLIETLREAWPDVPVVYTSGYSSGIVKDARAAFIGKPFSRDALIAAIETAAGKRGASGT